MSGRGEGLYSRLLQGPGPAAILGVVAFLLVMGWRVLDPANILWLGEGDKATYYLGWTFFRATPWSIPLGANPNYGLELGSSIVYSDSIPGLAFVFKLLDAALPEPFQYFGVWLLACFVLQAVMGWKLLTIASDSRVVRVAGTALLVFAPPFLARAGIHLALAGHWLILAALFVVLRPESGRRVYLWLVILCAAVFVHAYLFVMVAALWVADLAGRTRWEQDWKTPLAEVALLVGVSVLLMWLCGYFMLDASGLGGAPFGDYPLNILGPIDAHGWSYLLKDMPKTVMTNEGFSFLGLGTIILALLTIPRLRLSLPVADSLRFRPLVAVMALLTLLALTNKPSIGAIRLIDVPLPPSLDNALSVFQSSGRFFWPVYYVLVWLIIRGVARRFDNVVAGIVIALAACVQVLDTSAGWLAVRESIPVSGSKWQTRLESPFWDAAAKKYRRLKWVPPGDSSPHWRDLAYYASLHGMGTDAVYLARMNWTQMGAIRLRSIKAMRAGEFEPDVLYVLDPRYVRDLNQSLAAKAGVFAYVDGLPVFAPAGVSGYPPSHHSPDLR